MNILRKLLSSFLLVLFLSSPAYLKAQTDVALVELASEMFEFGDYEGALELYLQAIIINEQNLKANLMTGRCYLRTTNAKPKSIPYFHKAFRLNPDVSNKIFFYIGEGYRFGYEFDKAMEHYQRYLEMLETDSRCCPNEDIPYLIKRTKKRIEECRNAQKYVNAPGTAIITNLGDEVNSEFDDYAPTLSADGNLLFFTSRRMGSTGGLKDVDHKFYEDIFVSHYEEGKWTSPENMGDKINTIYHESNIGLSPDGTNLYIYTIENNGDIYTSKLKDGKWSKPKAFKHVNTDYQETTVNETSDGKMLFFSSNKPGGKGGLDIYYCLKVKADKWSDPRLLSDVINTEYDEEGAMFDVQNNILYFSSKGHSGMGGYDLYKSTYNPEEDTWTQPKNLGYPVNSSDDDLFFTLSSDGEKGYYASFKEDSRGGFDIYTIKFIDELEQARIAEERRKKEVVIGYKVIDDETGEVLNADISFLSSKTGESAGEMTFNGDLVQKTFTSDMEGDYVVTIKAQGDKVDEYVIENMDITITSSSKKQEINREIRLKRKVTEELIGENDPTEKEPDSTSTEEQPVTENTNTDHVPDTRETAAITERIEEFKPVTFDLTVVDSQTGKPLSATIKILKKGEDKVLIEKTIQSGKYQHVFNDTVKTQYVVIISSGQHVFRTIDLPIFASRDQAKIVQKVIELRVPKVTGTPKRGQILRNIYFDFDMHTLKSASYTELDQLEQMLRESVSIKIELAGHTDKIGSHTYNINLSLMRAKAVKNYLVGKGISSNRIDATGYGEDKPLASNDDEKEGRELNRRTEFIIISK